MTWLDSSASISNSQKLRPPFRDTDASVFWSMPLGLEGILCFPFDRTAKEHRGVHPFFDSQLLPFCLSSDAGIRLCNAISCSARQQ
jgi:hypothetical protein